MVVKENQPGLLADIVAYFARATAGTAGTAGTAEALTGPRRLQAVGDVAREPWPTPAIAQTLDLGHGRIERRSVSALSVPASATAWVNWPGRAQVLRIEREVTFKKNHKQRHEVVYGITSLPAAQAAPERLLELVRGHWQIENRSHWVRDVTFDEDRSTVRCGHVPQVLAALRNTAIGLMRQAGQTNIAAACRYHAANPWDALALLGIERTFK